MDEVLKRLTARMAQSVEKREQIIRQRSAIVEVAKQEQRDDLNPEEEVEFRGKTDELKTLDGEMDKLNERIAELSDEDERTQRAANAQRRMKAVDANMRVNERRTYEKGNGNSYFADLVRVKVNSDDNALGRLQRHAQENDLEHRDLTRTDTAGGYFVPPKWLVDQAIDIARAGRPFANLVTNQPLPAGTDSINIPKITTGTATAIQTADNAAVQETDIVDTVVSAGVKTVAGQQDVAIQLLDQSPVAFDELIFRDLMADYATKVNVQVLSGTNANGQVQGTLGTTGINAVTYTDATPTVGELYAKLADAVQQIHTGRFLPPTVIVMHPRRWGWFLAALDSSNRPLVVPNANNPMNAIGVMDGVVSQQVVGSIMGLPVVTDPSVPITVGAGTNEDQIIVMRASDLVLWESGIRSRVLPDVGSGTLTVRLQVYGYVAFTAARYAKSISVISGTGLITPTF
ncbi:MAG: phage major capsid protein [Actinomycetota bacterium]|nr:phage major capsid protein [Actinomycetota bacterium]